MTVDALACNARMYALDDEVLAWWQRLLQWVARHAQVPLAYVPHAPPAPLSALWRRDDLGAAAICGYPWARWDDRHGPRPVPIAAIMPSPARYAGEPRYCTDIVVLRDSPWSDVDSLRAARFGYTNPESQSGYQAVRGWLAERAREHGAAFGAMVGPLVTPRGIVDALLDDRIDAGPLDSYWHDLLRRHEPATAARLRTLASTPFTPNPFFVASAAVPEPVRRQLADAFVAAASAPELTAVRDALLIESFVPVDVSAYRTLILTSDAADALGYTALR